jgi:DHA1 family bicyclomycin/chloramphenicol resistance-like MFS transporter
MLAPSIGGALTDAFGWRAIFIAAAAAGGVILALVFWAVAESHHERASTRGFGGLLRGYRRLFAVRRFDAYVLHLGLASGAFFAHSTSASFLLIDVLGRSAAEYGLYFLAFPLGYVSGNFVAGRLAGRVRVETMVLVGATVSFVAVAGMAIAIGAGGLVPLSLFLPGALLTFGQGLSMPNSQSGAINVDRTLTGTASGLVVFAQFMFGALFAQLGGVLADGTAGPMIAIVVGASLLSLAAAAYPTVERRRGPVPAE